MNIFYVSGQFLPLRKASISAIEIGLLRSCEVLDFLQT
jgi:hypothetical protein